MKQKEKELIVKSLPGWTTPIDVKRNLLWARLPIATEEEIKDSNISPQKGRVYVVVSKAIKALKKQNKKTAAKFFSKNKHIVAPMLIFNNSNSRKI